MWFGTRIGGTYVVMPIILWLFIAPLIFAVYVTYYSCYFLVWATMSVYRWHIENKADKAQREIEAGKREVPQWLQK